MKILATADWHVGSGARFGYGEYGERSRLADQEKVLEQIAELALREHVDLMLFAGDLWHHPKPKPWEIEAAMRPMSLLRGSVPVVAINGNSHDVAGPHLPTALEVVFGNEWHVARTAQVIEIAGVSIACLPWVSPAHFIATHDGGGDRDELHATVAQLLCDTAAGLRASCAPDKPAILLGHWSVSGAPLPTGIMTDDLREVVLPFTELDAQEWDAMVFGHIHRAWPLGGTSRAFYVGSPCVVDFGEAEIKHGCTIIEWRTTDHPMEVYDYKQWPLADRPFMTLDIERDRPFTGGGFVIHPGYDVTNAVVRVRYTATEEQASRIDHDAITRALYEAGAHKVVGIQANVLREDRARVEGLTEEVTPMDALRLYCETQSINGTLASAMEKRTSAFLEEVAA